jgi:hypothetical protein
MDVDCSTAGAPEVSGTLDDAQQAAFEVMYYQQAQHRTSCIMLCSAYKRMQRSCQQAVAVACFEHWESQLAVAPDTGIQGLGVAMAEILENCTLVRIN